MSGIRIQSLKNQQVIADKCIEAVSFFVRLKGLIGKSEIQPGEGMWFPKCNSVHTWFMRIPIDVIFGKVISKDGKQILVVTSFRKEVRPWRFLPVGDWRATDTLELPSGAIQTYAITVGDELCIN